MTAGIGLTVIVNVTGVPVHDASVGVTVTVAVPAAEGVNEERLPVPEAPSPIAVFEFAQLKVALPLFPVKLIAVEVEPKQIVCETGALTVGLVLIVAKTAVLDDVQPFDVTST